MSGVLIILPPSESKRAPGDHGRPVALDELSFPELRPTRERIAEALVATSAGADAFARLLVRPTLAAQVERNTRLFDLPASPVLDVYSGPLHLGLDAASLSPAARDRAAKEVVVTSALWGALRPADAIPPYRLDVCAHLVDMEPLESTWRDVLPDVLAEAAGPSGMVVDLRSPGYQAMGSPTGLGARTVLLRVAQEGFGGRRIGDVIAKRVRGQAARYLIECGADPEDPGELAGLLGERWPVDLAATGPRGASTLTLFVTD
jgi:cytoplasmic iron level regulating protein YaaA (DUF328/UPF0246 family)